jgi:hypothetical protein
LDGHLSKYMFLKQSRINKIAPFESLCSIISDFYNEGLQTEHEQEYAELMECLKELVAEDELPIEEDGITDANETDYESLPDAAELTDSDDEFYLEDDYISSEDE